MTHPHVRSRGPSPPIRSRRPPSGPGRWTSNSAIPSTSAYIGLSAIILNIAVAVILTLIFKAAGFPGGADETQPRQYTAEPVEAPAPAGAGLGAARDLPRPRRPHATGW